MDIESIEIEYNHEENYYLGIKWEFMRRDKQYIAAWDRAKTAREKYGCHHDGVLTVDSFDMLQSYFLSPQSEAEFFDAQKFGIGGAMIDASLTFEDLDVHTRSKLNYMPFGMQGVRVVGTNDYNSELLRWLIFLAPKDMVAEARDRTKKSIAKTAKSTIGESLSIRLNLFEVSSISKLKLEIGKLLDDLWMAKCLEMCKDIDEVILKINKKYPNAIKNKDDFLSIRFDENILPPNTATVIRKIASGEISLKSNDVGKNLKFKKKINFEEILKIGDIAKSILENHPEYKESNAKYPGRLIDIIREVSGMNSNSSTESANQTIRERLDQYESLTNEGWRAIKYP